jgi:hypothetical protein
MCTSAFSFAGVGFVEIFFTCHSNIEPFFADDDDEVSIDNDDDSLADDDDFTDGVHGLDDDPSIVTIAPIVAGLTIFQHFVHTRERHRVPDRIKLMFFPFAGNLFTPTPFNTESGTITGHANAAGAFAVGAVDFRDTPEFGGELRVEPFSSAGGTPILFDGNGIRLPRPEFRQKPDFSCVDGVDTTFFGFTIIDDTPEFPNFFGTSASAPAAAAIAALMLEAQPSLTVPEVYKILRETAIDIGDFGFDFTSGHGFCDAPEPRRAGRWRRPHVLHSSWHRAQRRVPRKRIRRANQQASDHSDRQSARLDPVASQLRSP